MRHVEAKMQNLWSSLTNSAGRLVDLSSRRNNNRVYEYFPLHYVESDFRLLHVQPAEDATAPVVCSLSSANLYVDPPPVYETISYAWGTSIRRNQITVGSARIIVPESCLEAIRQVRLPNRVRTVWIDAICINQNDHEERAQQVRIMGDIYRRSCGNLAVLGHDDPDVPLALDDLKGVLEDMYEETDYMKNSRQVLKNSAGAFSTKPLPQSVDLIRLSRVICSKPWFK